MPVWQWLLDSAGVVLLLIILFGYWLDGVFLVFGVLRSNIISGAGIAVFSTV